MTAPNYSQLPHPYRGGSDGTNQPETNPKDKIALTQTSTRTLTRDLSQAIGDGDLSPVARRCKARSRRAQGQCRASAVRGATVCVAHGGRAPQVKAAAKRRLAVKAALRSVDLFGQPDTTDALSVLQREIGNMSGFTQQLERFLTQVSASDALVGEGRQVLDLYRQSQAQLVRTTRDALALGLEARAQQMVVTVSNFLADVLRTMTQAASLSNEQRLELQAVIAREMRALGSTLTLELPK
jgi:hypothetical protein